MEVPIIEKIHHDINTAYLKTFQKVQEIVGRDKVAENKIALYKLGFTKYQQEVTDNEEQLKASEILEQIKRYKIDYPHHHFITYDELGVIMDKYDLVISTPERFKGEIPEKNIRQILDFKLKELDIMNVEWDEDRQNGVNFTYREIIDPKHNVCSAVKNALQYFPKNNILIDFRKLLKSDDENIEKSCIDVLGKYCGEEFIKDLMYSSVIPKYFYFENVLFNIKVVQLPHSNHIYYIVDSIQNIDKKQPLIVNPFKEVENGGRCNTEINILVGTQDQFKLNPGEVFINSSIMPYDINGKQPWIFNDPIAFVPVRNGLLAKSMWGEEAKLPEFFDSSQN